MNEAGQLGDGGGGAIENWKRAHVPLRTIATWLLLIERLSNAFMHGGAVYYFELCVMHTLLNLRNILKISFP